MKKNLKKALALLLTATMIATSNGAVFAADEAAAAQEQQIVVDEETASEEVTAEAPAEEAVKEEAPKQEEPAAEESSVNEDAAPEAAPAEEDLAEPQENENADAQEPATEETVTAEPEASDNNEEAAPQEEVEAEEDAPEAEAAAEAKAAEDGEFAEGTATVTVDGVTFSAQTVNYDDVNKVPNGSKLVVTQLSGEIPHTVSYTDASNNEVSGKITEGKAFSVKIVSSEGNAIAGLLATLTITTDDAYSVSNLNNDSKKYIYENGSAAQRGDNLGYSDNKAILYSVTVSAEGMKYVAGQFKEDGANSGIFDNAGKAVLELQDGTLVSVQGTASIYQQGYRMEVNGSEITTSMSAGHGVITSGKYYEITIYDTDGNRVTTGAAADQVTITSTTNFAAGSTIVSGFTKLNERARTEITPATNTITTGSTAAESGVANQESFKVLIGSWDGVDDTFISTGGSYTLGYILSRYNVFLSNDWDMGGNHIVGPMVIGGNAGGSMGGGSGDNPGYVHDVPSYFGTSDSTTVTTVSSVPVYFGMGSKDKSYTLAKTSSSTEVSDSSKYYDYYFAKQFVDFSSAMAALKAEASGFSGTAVESSTKQSDGLSYWFDGTTLNVTVGGSYELTADQLKGITAINYIGEFEGGNDTFIICNDSSVTLPKTLSNGNELASIENGMTGSVVYMLPNATSVSGNGVSGHVVAPYAEVTLTGGYFNGCVIAKTLKGSAEGHMWNYNGKTLVPGSAELKASKTVDGKVPSASQQFTFKLYELTDGKWEEIDTKSNNGTDIVFKSITYNDEGNHWYRISESGSYENYNVDETQYIVNIIASQNAEAGTTTIEKEVRYYKVKESDLETLLDNEGKIVNERLEALAGVADVAFNNTTKTSEKASLTVQKNLVNYNHGDLPAQTAMTFHVGVYDSTATDAQPVETAEITVAKGEYKGSVTIDGLTVGETYYVYEIAGSEGNWTKLNQWDIVPGTATSFYCVDNVEGGFDNHNEIVIDKTSANNVRYIKNKVLHSHVEIEKLWSGAEPSEAIRDAGVTFRFYTKNAGKW